MSMHRIRMLLFGVGIYSLVMPVPVLSASLDPGTVVAAGPLAPAGVVGDADLGVSSPSMVGALRADSSQVFEGDELTGTWKGNWSSGQYPHPVEVHIEMASDTDGWFSLLADHYCYEGEITIQGGWITFLGDECEGGGLLDVSGTQWPVLGLLRLHGTFSSEVMDTKGDWAMTLYRVDESP